LSAKQRGLRKVRRRSFGERLKKELVGLGISLVFVLIVIWLALYVFPDLFTEMFQDAIKSATERN
jgi:hypothetical protein